MNKEENKENITVISTSNNLWLKPPRIYILVLILVLIIIVILGVTFLTLKNRFSKPKTIQQTQDSKSASPAAQIQPAKSEGGAGQKPKLQNIIKPEPLQR